MPNLFNVTSFDDILDRELSSEKWIVNGIIPETGLYLLMGAEKTGKSLFTLQCAYGIATGEPVFGKIPVTKNKVLFISLEESCQLLQKRAKLLNFSKPGNNLMVVHEINHHQFYNTVETLDQMLESDPSIRFVIIDTIQLFLDVADLDKDMASIYCLQALKETAYYRQVSILMVHYTNKIGLNESLDSIFRSLGRIELTALCDAVLCLTKIRNERRANLFVTGSETMEKVYSLIIDDNTGWVLEGDKREVVEGDTQKLVADWLKNHGKGRPIDIYNGLKTAGYMGSSDTIRQTCHRMKKAGKLRYGKGAYLLYTPTFTMSESEIERGDTLAPPVTPVTVSR